jgi:hypothetical protein
MSSLPEKPRRSQPEKVWEVDGPFGPEQWFFLADKFTHVVTTNRTLSLLPESGDLDQLLPRAATCQHTGPWPNAFKFCPHCGKPLAEPVGWPPPQLWNSPFGASDGLPHVPIAAVPATRTRQAAELPSPASLTFVVAGTPPRLFAFDMRQGHLHRWIDLPVPDPVPIKGIWRELLRLGSADMIPRWSWSAAAFEGGFAMPTNASPTWVQASADKPLAVLNAENAGPPIGGAARVRDVAVVPVRGDNGIDVAHWSTKAGAWRVEAVPDAPNSAGQQLFGIPVTVNEEAFWPGEQGQLYASVEGDRVGTAYRPWPDGFRPMLGVRPTREASGALYQLGRLDNRPVLEALLRPRATPMQRPSRGIGISCGIASFREGKRYDAPWEIAHRATYPLEDLQFLVPLLAFGQDQFLFAVCSPRLSLVAFLETSAAQRRPFECRIAFSSGSRNLVELNHVIRADAIFDISCFMFRNHLFIYDAGKNTCAGWALDGTDAAPRPP